jgi:hypothetical protein
LSTDHEELYKNLLKPRIKVGNDFLSQVSTLMEPPMYCQMYKIANFFFKFKAYQKEDITVHSINLYARMDLPFHSFLNSALHTDMWSALWPTLYPKGENHRYPLRCEVQRTPDTVWTFLRRRKSLTGIGFSEQHRIARRLVTIQTVLAWSIFQ